MADHATAITALSTTVTMHDTRVPETPEYPYAVLTSPGAFGELSEVLSDTPADIDAYVKVTVAHLGIEGVRDATAAVRASLDRSHPAVTDYSTDLRLSAAGDVLVDYDVTIPGHGHPLYVTDTYRYRATRA